MPYISVAALKDIPEGKTLKVFVEGHPILLAHAEGKLYAVDDTCSHEEASLSLGALKGHCIKCPLHGSRFDLETGRPLEEPADAPLKTYEVKVKGEEVMIRWP